MPQVYSTQLYPPRPQADNFNIPPSSYQKFKRASQLASFTPPRAPAKKKMAADLFPRQCMFKQRSLMELLAEINEIIIEEDNLIEIDISIGSIKCSRFEIEA